MLSFENRYFTQSGEIVWLSKTSLVVEAPQVAYAIEKNITHKKKIEEDHTKVIKNFAKIISDSKV